MNRIESFFRQGWSYVYSILNPFAESTGTSSVRQLGKRRFDEADQVREPSMRTLQERKMSLLPFHPAEETRTRELLTRIKQLDEKALLEEFISSSCGVSFLRVEDLLRFEEGQDFNSHIMDTFFENMVTKSKSCRIARSNLLIFRDPKKLFRTADGKKALAIFRDDTPIYLPINRGNCHWALVKIDMQTKKFYLYDSLLHGPCKEMEELSSILHRIAEEEGVPLEQDAFTEVVLEPCPRQRNSSDCGVFVCMAAEKLMKGEPLDIAATDFPHVRTRMLYDFIIHSQSDLVVKIRKSRK